MYRINAWVNRWFSEILKYLSKNFLKHRFSTIDLAIMLLLQSDSMVPFQLSLRRIGSMVKVAITFNCLNSVSILSAVLLILFSKLSHLSALLLVLESKNSHFHSSQHCSLENFQTFVFCTFILLVRVLPLPALLLVLTFTPQQVLTPNPPLTPISCSPSSVISKGKRREAGNGSKYVGPTCKGNEPWNMLHGIFRFPSKTLQN